MTRIAAPPYKCNVCGKQRTSDTNHWFVLTASLGHMSISVWNDGRAEMENVAHSCGQEHTQVLVARWLDHGSFEEK